MKLPKISQFPNIFRFITEKVKNSKEEIRKIGTVFIFVSLISLIFMAGLDLTHTYSKKTQISNTKSALLSQQKYWQDLVEKDKGYRDGYFMLAVLQYQLKDMKNAQQNIEKVLTIDPNFSPAIDLQKVISREVN